LMHEFFPVHLTVFGSGKHAFQHEEITAYVTDNTHSNNYAVKYDETNEYENVPR
jgi:hypothetical protein